MKPTALAIFLLSTLLLILAACGESDDSSSAEVVAAPVGRTLVMGDNSFESQWINNAIARFILEHGYGHPVQIETASSPELQAGLANGSVDIWLEMWQQNWFETYDEQVQAGNIADLGPVYEGGPQFWMVPANFSLRHNIGRIEDMARQDVIDELKQASPTGAAQFINCPESWACAGINEAKLKAYGLVDDYEIVSPVNGQELDQLLINARSTGDPIFTYYWAPTSIFGRYNWARLSEPEYTSRCWSALLAGIEDEDRLPSDGCAYATIDVDIGVHGSVTTELPEVTAFLEAFNTGLVPLTETAAWAAENQVDLSTEWDRIARHYLGDFGPRWRKWVPEDVEKRVTAALEAE